MSKPFLYLITLLTTCLLTTAAPTPANASIDWFHCKQNATWPVTCGILAVPLDYTDLKSGKTLSLSLLKINATKEPVKGSVLVNPGGPGEGAREFLAGYAQQLLVATGGHFNLIAWDTRGTGDTIPFSCYKSDSIRTLENLVVPQTSNNSDTAAGELWSASTSNAMRCAEQLPEIGRLVSTAFVARDMIQIVDALGEDGMLRYYGLFCPLILIV